MAFDDVAEDVMRLEVGIAAAVTAALFTPQVRGLLRRGAIYGLSGLLTAGDGVGALAKRLVPDSQQAGDADFARQLAAEARSERAKHARARSTSAHDAPSPAAPQTEVERKPDAT